VDWSWLPQVGIVLTLVGTIITIGSLIISNLRSLKTSQKLDMMLLRTEMKDANKEQNEQLKSIEGHTRETNGTVAALNSRIITMEVLNAERARVQGLKDGEQNQTRRD
jgi:hypothetical protein